MPRFLKNKWLWIGLVLVVLVVVGFMAMQQGAAAKKAETEKAAAEKIDSPYAAIANGKADVEGGIIQVAARRGGVVKAVYVQEGERVTTGQILARQEDDEPRLALARAQAEVAQAESQLRSIQVDISTARREHDRLARLVETNFVAAARMDEAR
ncbi:MAG: biotin/lipoyl-binding protein, partial [Alphaproteobacteria bacterium]|nr:biotin/lipoyl-binding protein [Alphaproteobacteria bacterium]